MNRGVPILAHVLFAIGLIGEVLTVALTAPHDPEVLTWRAPDALLAVLTVVSGWILAWRRPAIPIGWLLLAVGVIEAPAGPGYLLGESLAVTDPTAAGWFFTFGFESRWTWIPGLGTLVILLPLYFPTGRIPSPRWRWFSWYAIAALVVSTGLAATVGGPLDLVGRHGQHVPNPTAAALPGGDATAVAALGLLLTTAAIGSLASLLVRYRHAAPVERAQLRWVFWAVAIIVGWLLFEQVENAVFGDENSHGAAGIVAHVLDLIAGLTFCLVPLAVLIGVLRYGLYEIDRIISRTAAYAIVTLVVVGTYGLVVLLVSLLIPHDPHEPTPPIVIALATLAAAAIGLPALRWIRRLVDRVFNRSQYDAERVVIAYGERVRNGADPHTAGVDLIDAVERTLQPVAVGIWTRDTTR